MNITIVGAGNIGTQFASHCAEKGHRVIVFTSKPDKISKELIVVNEKNERIHSGIIKKQQMSRKKLLKVRILFL